MEFKSGDTQVGDEPFPHQLLKGLVVAQTSEACTALCAEAWVRLGNAVSATLISPRSPTILQAIVCRYEEGSNPSFERFEVQESFSSLLDNDAIEQIAPSTSGSHEQLTIRWPQLLACVVVEFKPSPEASASDRTIVQTLSKVCQQLLSRSLAYPVLFPNPNHMAAMAEFAAGAGHEINNPLGSILGQTQLLLKSEDQIDKRQSLETIGSQAWRIRDMIGDAMVFARPPAKESVTGNLVDVVREATKSTASNYAGPTIEPAIEVEFRCAEPGIEFEFDPVQISSLVSNLVRNSIEAIKSSGTDGKVTVVLRTSRRGFAVELIVRDTGPGVYEDTVRRHLFDPFFSGRPAGRGLGFGLSLVWQIVSMHQGILLQHNLLDRAGCEFHVALPLRQRAE